MEIQHSVFESRGQIGSALEALFQRGLYRGRQEFESCNMKLVERVYFVFQDAEPTRPLSETASMTCWRRIQPRCSLGCGYCGRPALPSRI
jgi:hypothetical protein